MQHAAQQTSANTHELDERLRQEMERLARCDSGLRELMGGAGAGMGGVAGPAVHTMQPQTPTGTRVPPSAEGTSTRLSGGGGEEATTMVGSALGTSFASGRAAAVGARGGVGTMLKICVVEAKGLALDDKIRCNPHAAIVMGKVKKSTR